MKLKCIQCGKNFELKKSEIEFYKSKNLHLPKRCKACREKNKAKKEQFARYTVKMRRTRDLQFAWTFAFCFIGLVLSFITLQVIPTIAGLVASSLVFIFVLLLSFKTESKEIQEFDTSKYEYTFRNNSSMIEHYIKHGLEIDADTLEDYLLKANQTITNPTTLRKKAKDKDDILYYNTKTEYFVVVSEKGYIRSFYKTSLNKFKRQ